MLTALLRFPRELILLEDGPSRLRAMLLMPSPGAWHSHQCPLTASQNHRLFGVGRALCGSPSPTPLPKQGHPEPATQDLVQAGFEYLQRRRLHSLPGQPEPKQAMGRFVWFETCVENARGRKTSWERSNQQLQPRIEASTVNAAWQSCGLSWNCCFNGEDCQIVL